MDARYAAFQANGFGVASPAAIKQWIASARSGILATVQNEGGNAAFAVTSGATVTTATNLVPLTGIAPVELATLEVNGVAWPLRWTTVNSWSLTLPVGAGSNPLRLVGYDLAGAPVAGASNLVTVTYTGPAPSPIGNVVLNEIMYHPVADGASFIELLNLSPNFNFDSPRAPSSPRVNTW
jgi:hypothetical protein